MLGASGAAIGTRFATSKESSQAPQFKLQYQALSKQAQSKPVTTSTLVYDVITGPNTFPAHLSNRVARNKLTDTYPAATDAQQRDYETLKQRLIVANRDRPPNIDWDVVVVPVGQGIGLVDDINQPCEEIVRQMVTQCSDSLRSIASSL